MATKPKKTQSYDLKAADRKRNMLIQIGLTAVVVIFAVALVLYIVTSGETKPSADEGKAIRVTSSKLVTKDGTTEPKVVLGMYEDFLCPACGAFEQAFGPTVSALIDSGAVAADYYMVAILDRPANKNYSSRAGAAAYCVADESNEAFRRFHAALYAQQPSEVGSAFPDRRAADRDRPSGRCRGFGSVLYQQWALHRHGGRPGQGDRSHRNPDHPDQRRGLQVLDARRVGRQGQGDGG